ncbi:unnamed protein product [Brachionus calyciflorus]|uniref:Uncharacterized protein n=1 Tax=Brachionus calyciflorus TaxID=104777 RepID=A0A813Z8M8_9BILA|nr:unnamed protein product [Brachionus calyciflorus]
MILEGRYWISKRLSSVGLEINAKKTEPLTNQVQTQIGMELNGNKIKCEKFSRKNVIKVIKIELEYFLLKQLDYYYKVSDPSLVSKFKYILILNFFIFSDPTPIESKYYDRLREYKEQITASALVTLEREGINLNPLSFADSKNLLDEIHSITSSLVAFEGKHSDRNRVKQSKLEQNISFNLDFNPNPNMSKLTQQDQPQVSLNDIMTAINDINNKVNTLEGRIKSGPQLESKSTPSSRFLDDKMDEGQSGNPSTSKLNFYYDNMVASLKEFLRTKNNKFFKARDYHELEYVLLMNDEIVSQPARVATNEKVRLLFLVGQYGWDYALKLHKNQEVRAAGGLPQDDEDELSELSESELLNPLDDEPTEEPPVLPEHVDVYEPTILPTNLNSPPRPVTPQNSPDSEIFIPDGLSPQTGTRLRSIVEKIKVEDYFDPPTNIRQFDKEFPLPKNLKKKWINGVRIWPKANCARTRGSTTSWRRADPNRDLVIHKLLKANIIEEVQHRKPPRYLGSLFLVQRPGAKVS